MKKVFGLEQLSGKIPQLLKIPCEDKNDPSKWTWIPAKPEKIKNLREHLQKERKTSDYSAITNYIPKKNIKQDVVFVFWMGNLSHGIINHLDKNKIKYFFLNYMHFILKGEVEVLISNTKTKKILKIDNAQLDLDDVKIVLWTPPQYPHPMFDFDMIPAKKGRHEYLYKKRWSQLLRDLILLVPKDTIWIPGNPLNGSQDWQNKIGELNLAKEIGFNIPDTIYTNNIDEFKKNVKNKSHNILLREFSVPPYSFPPIPINVEKTKFNNFKSSPSCFQKYIEKKYEYRVIVLFDKIFPCKIYSQDSELAKNDWRIHDDAKVKWELTNLPKDVCNKILKFRKALNLNWCSIDMIYGKDNKYYFLEANRPGAHYWLDLFVGLDITKEIAEAIKKIL